MKFSCLHNGFTVHVAVFSHCGSNDTIDFPLPNIDLPDEVLFVLRQFLPLEHRDNVDDAMAYETNSWGNMVRDLAMLQESARHFPAVYPGSSQQSR